MNGQCGVALAERHIASTINSGPTYGAGIPSIPYQPSNIDSEMYTSSQITEAINPRIFERRGLASPLTIQAVATAEVVHTAPPPNTPLTAALQGQEKGHTGEDKPRRFLAFKPREYVPTMNIRAGIFPDDQAVIAAPPNSPITSCHAKLEEDEVSLLVWAMELLAGWQDDENIVMTVASSDSTEVGDNTESSVL